MQATMRPSLVPESPTFRRTSREGRASVSIEAGALSPFITKTFSDAMKSAKETSGAPTPRPSIAWPPAVGPMSAKTQREMKDLRLEMPVSPATVMPQMLPVSAGVMPHMPPMDNMMPNMHQMHMAPMQPIEHITSEKRGTRATKAGSPSQGKTHDLNKDDKKVFVMDAVRGSFRRFGLRWCLIRPESNNNVWKMLVQDTHADDAVMLFVNASLWDELGNETFSYNTSNIELTVQVLRGPGLVDGDIDEIMGLPIAKREWLVANDA